SMDTTTINSLNTSENVNLTGGTLHIAGTLRVAAPNLFFRVAGGTLRGATVAVGSDVYFTTAGGTLDGVTFNGRLITAEVASQAPVTNGLIVNGLASLTSGGVLRFAGSQTVAGIGTVDLDRNGTLQVVQANTTLTLGPALLVRGLGGT